MEQEIFKAGVRPGSPNTNDEIKMLICFLLHKLAAPMRFAQLHEALTEHELVNYFELIPAVEMLVQTGHLTARQDKDGAVSYQITALGQNAATEFAGSLPHSARENAFKAAELLLKRQKREAEVDVQITKQPDGYTVRLKLPQEQSGLIDFTVFCPTHEEAQLVRKRFLNDPVFIYKGVMALLTGDQAVLGKIFPAEEVLF